MSPKLGMTTILASSIFINILLLFSSCDRYDPKGHQVERLEESQDIRCLTKRSKLSTADCIKLLDAAVARGQIAAGELSPYLFWEVKPGKRTLDVLRVYAAGTFNSALGDYAAGNFNPWRPLAYLLAQSCDINDIREALVIYERMISSPEFPKKFEIPRDRLETEKAALSDAVKELASKPVNVKTQDPACIDFSVVRN